MVTADLRNTYKLLRAELGITKKDADFAIALADDEDDEMMAEHRRRMQLARWEGHAIGTQSDLFDDVDRTPAADRAFAEGKKAGLSGETKRCDYAPETEQYRQFMSGWDAGQTVLTKGFKKPEDDADVRPPFLSRAEAEKAVDGLAATH